MTYLYEIGRVSEPASAPLSTLRRKFDLQIADVSLAEVVEAAIGISWTRDPFDRLISAHAIVANAPLVTADETIREHLSLAVWD